METAVTGRGQTVIPAAIRRHYHIAGGSRLIWIDDGESIRVIPAPADPLRALRGRARGSGLTEKLLAERRTEREMEGR